MDSSLEICKSANRINLAAHFSMTSGNPDSARRTVLEAARIGQDVLVRLDPSLFRTFYEATMTAEAPRNTVDERFESTVGDLLQRQGVHQIPITRLGSAICNWSGDEVPFGLLGDCLDDINEVVSDDDQSVTDHLIELGADGTKLLGLSDAFYGLAVVMAAINSRPHELNGFRREIAAAAAEVLLNSSKRLLK